MNIDAGHASSHDDGRNNTGVTPACISACCRHSCGITVSGTNEMLSRSKLACGPRIRIRNFICPACSSRHCNPASNLAPCAASSHHPGLSPLLDPLLPSLLLLACHRCLRIIIPFQRAVTASCLQRAVAAPSFAYYFSSVSRHGHPQFLLQSTPQLALTCPRVISLRPAKPSRMRFIISTRPSCSSAPAFSTSLVSKLAVLRRLSSVVRRPQIPLFSIAVAAFPAEPPPLARRLTSPALQSQSSALRFKIV